jgi:hypothetical protein
VLGYSGSSEYQPLGYDLLALSSLYRWGNFDYATNQTHWDSREVPADVPLPDTQTLPLSLFLASKPSWWGSTPWPPIGPDVIGGDDPSGHAYKVPAQTCYENSARDSAGILIFNAIHCYPSS